MARKGTLAEQANRDFYTLLRSILRRAWVRFPERAKCLQAARKPYRGDNKRQKWEYECCSCKGAFMQKEVVVDHIIPCGTFLSEKDWSTFGPGLFCKADNLQVLCRNCHKLKTASERSAAREKM